MPRKNTQITGNIGMYYVCFKLSELGRNVMPTARNAKGIDIVAYREDGEYVGIQVKTLSKPNAIGLGKSLEKSRRNTGALSRSRRMRIGLSLF